MVKTKARIVISCTNILWLFEYTFLLSIPEGYASEQAFEAYLPIG